MSTKTVAKINDVKILMVDEGEKFVPIKPICEALGVNYSTQLEKIKADEILGSTVPLRGIVAADGKEREMACLPYMLVFGWLFSINSKNVALEAKEAVTLYKMECYRALFNHFTAQSKFLEEKQVLLQKHLNEVDTIRADFNNTKKSLKTAQQELNRTREWTFEQWRADQCQTKLDL